ncbi:MAG TPA: lamin tail domain-containing protein, partial [Verrucomicrobiota bacterium]|nr:lamin tail domain-containing protein [Verrucomicrobiota bacterium]HNU52470.1 lamin tail domain-containing protein [Verrucomicrobiota bacterium]
ANVNMTNEYGEIFVLRIDARVDIVGQAKPTTPVTILGVLSQFDTNDPRASGYQLLPTRFTDILSASKAPAIRFTNHLANLVRPGDLPANTFTDHALRPGESLTIKIQVVDPEGRTITVKPETAGLPASAQWSFDALSGTTVTGQFSFQPTAADAGQLYPVTLAAWNTAATNTQVWNVYVPTPAEQQIVLTEYLANPSSDPAAPHFNPLGRTPVEEHLNPGQHDEYLEFANLSTEHVDLLGWSIADGVGVRHRFYDTLVLGAGGALIVYGGPLNGLLPNLDVPSIPASESSAGLALNNNGDTLTVRNADGHVVLRVVYPESQVAPDGSYTRYPDANGDFLPHPCVSTLPVSPGHQYDDRPWSEPPALGPGQVNNLRIALTASGTPRILWQAEPNRVYSVWQASRIQGPFSRIASCLASGEFDDTASADANRFYRVSTP